MGTKVTDPALLAELNGTPAAAPKKVTDPALLAQLNGTAAPAAKPAAPESDGIGGRFARLVDPDEWAGSKLGRFAIGAASPVTGSLQLASHLAPMVGPFAGPLGGMLADIGPEKVDAAINAVDASKRRGMNKGVPEGQYNPDIAGTAGSLVTGMAATKGLPVAQALTGRILQGSALGAASGLTSPVVGDTADYNKNKTRQVETGAVVGGALPVVTAAAGWLGQKGRNVYDVIAGTKGGIERIKRAYYERLVGKDNVPSVVNSLKNADDIVAGGKPTAAEAVSNNPAGTAIQAQQAATAGTPGGVSADFNNRLYAQGVARRSAELERGTMTAPMRDAALSSATNINPLVLEGDLVAISSHPDVIGVKAARGLLESVQDDAVNAAKSGDARVLYGVRKYIDDLIEGRIESEKNVAKSMTPRLIEMKKAIDKSIENGGAGHLWTDYLSEFAKRSKAIEASTERAAGMYSPAQRTAIQGGSNVAEHTATHLPNLLSREAMIANWVAKAARGRIEPKIDASMARDFLDPKLMASVMEKSTPQSRKLIADALARHMRLSPMLATQQQQEQQ